MNFLKFFRKAHLFTDLHDIVSFDVSDLQTLKDDNKNFRYLAFACSRRAIKCKSIFRYFLVCENLWSKYCFCLPLLNKTGKSTADAAAIMLDKHEKMTKGQFRYYVSQKFIHIFE